MKPVLNRPNDERIKQALEQVSELLKLDFHLNGSSLESDNGIDAVCNILDAATKELKKKNKEIDNYKK
ncbi:MAG: hypothetical protein K0S26_2394, partial [Bacteroidota bacterium]|nr:hypothetical protein [Bacteroidota bacterium]